MRLIGPHTHSSHNPVIGATYSCVTLATAGGAGTGRLGDICAIKMGGPAAAGSRMLMSATSGTIEGRPNPPRTPLAGQGVVSGPGRGRSGLLYLCVRLAQTAVGVMSIAQLAGQSWRKGAGAVVLAWIYTRDVRIHQCLQGAQARHSSVVFGTIEGVEHVAVGTRNLENGSAATVKTRFHIQRALASIQKFDNCQQDRCSVRGTPSQSMHARAAHKHTHQPTHPPTPTPTHTYIQACTHARTTT